jgi:nitrous oxidase accessory protein NosD
MKMKIRFFMTGLLALAVLAPAANALTVQNADTKAYELKWTPKGGKVATLSLKASSNTDIDCKAGCTLNIGGKDQTVDGKAAKIVIKGGMFVP